MEFVHLEVKDHVGIVTLEREPLNSINFQMYEEIKETFESINKMDDIRVVVLRANGKLFSAGNDVNEFTTIQERFTEYIDIVKYSIGAVYACRVPVVGAIQGAAIGAGMALAASCDIVVAAEETKFGIPEIKVGIIGAAEFADLLVPRKVVNYMALSGNPITAEDIQQYGGIHKIVEEEKLLDTAYEIVDELLDVGPVALRYFKAALQNNLNAQLIEKYTHEAKYTEKYLETDDFTEAINAFLEKRKPHYSGK